MPWLELRIHSSREQAPLLEDALTRAGAQCVTLEDNADQPIFEPALGETPLWQETRIIGLFEGDADTSHIEQQVQIPAATYYQWHLVEDKDWEREWMKDYRPIQCGEHFWICPSWLEPPDPSAINLLLDPGLAFGTGTHPTTFLCLQWLAQQNLSGLDVIDYGCGSGILGIGALLLGAQQVLGVDIDPQALLATQENAARNGIAAARFPVVYPNRCAATAVDVVLANILAGPLVELAPAISSRVNPGGSLCLSGILNTQASAVMAAYSAEFDFDPIASKDDWVCLSARKHTAALG